MVQLPSDPPCHAKIDRSCKASQFSTTRRVSWRATWVDPLIKQLSKFVWHDRKTTQDIGWSSFSKFSLRKWPFYGPQFLNKKNKPVEDTACRLLVGTAVGEILLAWQGSEAPCLASCPIAGMYTTVTLSVYIWCTDMEVLYRSYILDIDDVHIHIWYIVFKDIHLPPGQGCRPEVDHVPNFWRFVWWFSGECLGFI